MPDSLGARAPRDAPGTLEQTTRHDELGADGYGSGVQDNGEFKTIFGDEGHLTECAAFVGVF